jgi:hypothetical protein
VEKVTDNQVDVDRGLSHQPILGAAHRPRPRL